MASWPVHRVAKTLALIAGKDPLAMRGGHSSYVRTHAKAALQAGFEPHIFCVSDRSDVSATDFGILHRVASPFRPFRQIMVAGHAPLITANLERFLLNRQGPHLIHGFGLWGCIGVAARQRLRQKGIEAVPVTSCYTTYEHEALGKLKGVSDGYSPFHRKWYRAQLTWIKLMVRRYERQSYLGSHLVLINYESVRRIVVAQYGSGVKFRKLPYTCESAVLRSQTEAFATRSEHSSSETPLIVSVSRHDARKGIDVLFRAFAKLRMDGFRFRACLVGGGPLLEFHRGLATQLGLNEVISIVGWVSDPAEYLRKADVFVLPSLQEGSGSLSLIEALQAGVPVVASQIDGIPEDVADGDSALLVEPGNVSQLCHALGQVITDATLRRRLKRRSRETFVEKFSSENFISALRATYAELGFLV
jgi:glycosyltransferase involved in cell wall biosynthesis